MEGKGKEGKGGEKGGKGKGRGHTLLGEAPPLVGFELGRLLPSLTLNGGVALGLGVGKHHGFVKQREGLHLLDCILGGLGIVKHHERLAFVLERLLGDDLSHVSVLAEDG